MAKAESAVQIGIVSSVNASDMTARVYYPDQGNMVSGWLYVLQRGDNWMPAVNDCVLCVTMKDADGYILGAIE